VKHGLPDERHVDVELTRPFELPLERRGADGEVRVEIIRRRDAELILLLVAVRQVRDFAPRVRASVSSPHFGVGAHDRRVGFTPRRRMGSKVRRFATPTADEMLAHVNGFHLRLSLSCPGCAQFIPLDALAPVVTCTGCGRGVPIELQEWKRVLETAVLQFARGQDRVNLEVAGASIEGVVAPASPRCRCGALLTEDELASAGGARVWLRHRCGAQILVRSFPDLDTIGRVVGESNPQVPSPPGAGFIVTLRGWLDERIRNAVKTASVWDVLVDTAGNLYCVGSIYVTTPREDEDDDENDDEQDEDNEDDVLAKDDDDEHTIDAIWSWDPSLRLRWKFQLPSACLQISLLAPATLTYFPEGEGEPTSLSVADGSRVEISDEATHLADYAQPLRDSDGTWVVLSGHTISRLAPSQGWSKVPLFKPQGFFSRLTSSNEMHCGLAPAIALASDGDLVLSYAEEGEKLQLTRFDRQGHRKLSVPSPVGGSFGSNTRLETGVGGTVWAWGEGKLFAVTPVAVHTVALPPEATGLEPAFAAMPDGSLLFFGDAGRVMRTTMNGVVVARWEQVGGV
jgi:hypothetical protein